MFEHSVKVPRVYKAAAGVLKRAESSEGPAQPRLRRLLAELDDRRFNKNAIYALLVEAIKREKRLNELFDETGLFRDEPRLDRWLARVLVTELILGNKKPPGESKPVRAALKFYNLHKDRLDLLKVIADRDFQTAPAPRYVRINTLRLSAADAVRNFQDEGWNLIRCTGGSYDDYLKQIKNLGEYDFIPDYHVKVVFAFPPKTSFADSFSYQNGELFLQDKATCLAGYLLSPTPGSAVLDMCAAPGMKTTHMASIMKNEGVIYSVEQDKERCKVLQQFVDSAGASCVKIINKDVLTVTKNECPNIDYVLLDPSCSGSGIKRIETNDADHDFQSGRLEKLSRFQAKLLRHALNEFRTAKRVVYSTCSLYPQENEAVVEDVVRNHKGNFKLVSAKMRLNDNWNNIGDIKYRGVGEKCIYARPETDFTSGFFIAIFEQEVNEKKIDDSHQPESNMIDGSNSKIEYFSSGHDSKIKCTSQKTKSECLKLESIDKTDLIMKDSAPKVKSKKKKHNNIELLNSSTELSQKTTNYKSEFRDCLNNVSDIQTTEDTILTVNEDLIPKKKKKKYKDLQIEDNAEYDNFELQLINKNSSVASKDLILEKKSKKRHQIQELEETSHFKCQIEKPNKCLNKVSKRKKK